MRSRRTALSRLILSAAFAATLAGAGAASAQAAGLPDAEIFATNNTAVITDSGDPRLDERLRGFGRKVERMVERGGGQPRGSRLLDGVFFSSELETTTFERSRDFDVEQVTRRELRDIAERVRRRFDQQSVLTFDYAERPTDRKDAIEASCPAWTRSGCATACWPTPRRASACSAAR